VPFFIFAYFFRLTVKTPVSLTLHRQILCILPAFI